MKNIFLVSKVLSFRHTKQTNKNVAYTTFNNVICFELSFTPPILVFQGHHKIPEELVYKHLAKALFLYFVVPLPNQL